VVERGISSESDASSIVNCFSLLVFVGRAALWLRLGAPASAALAPRAGRRRLAPRGGAVGRITGRLILPTQGPKKIH